MNKILFNTRIRHLLPLVLAAALQLLLNIEAIADPAIGPAAPLAELEEAEVLTRMENMGCLIPVKLTKEVKDQIYRYTESYKKGSGEILGRAEMYFPLFDQYLAEAGVPEQLKYLSIVESALNPNAVSGAGAAGLWQFIRQTGRHYGLTINRTVDERRDPHRATQSAVRYLKDLYGMFGDWSLALAAYNSGPGRVKEAIQRANSTDFWKIKNYLPRETRNYVPAFIAASYLVNYYYLHGIEPILQSDEYVFTSSILVYEKIDFSDIAHWTGLDVATIQQLNPAYLRSYIPGTTEGHYLILPNTHIHMVVEHLKNPDQAQWVGIMPAFIPAIEETAATFDDNESDALIAKEDLVRMVALEPMIQLQVMTPEEHLPASNKQTADREIPRRNEPARVETGTNFIYYRLRKGQSLAEVAEMKGLPVEDLISWNENILEDNSSLTGKYIRIPAAGK